MRRAACIATLLTALMALSSKAADRVVSVSGHGEKEVEPDIATAKLGVFVFNRDLLKSKQEADDKISSLLSLFKKLGMKP